MNEFCWLVPEPCRFAHWSTADLIGALSFFATAVGLAFTATFSFWSARNSGKLLRDQQAAMLDIPALPYGPEVEGFGEGLRLNLSRHVHGVQIIVDGVIRNMGRFAASEVDLRPSYDGQLPRYDSEPISVLFPLYPPDQFVFTWVLEGDFSALSDEQIVTDYITGHVVRIVVDYIDGNGRARPPFDRCYVFQWEAEKDGSRSKVVDCHGQPDALPRRRSLL